MNHVTCSSHLPILAELVSIGTIKNVLEFGAGLYSTPFFLKWCNKVTSIETNNKWFTRLVKQLGDAINLDMHYVNQEMVLHYFSNSIVLYDLIFIDTVNKIRRDLVKSSIRCTSNIILHDSQLPFLNKIELKGYTKFVFCRCPIKYPNGKRPWTTLFTKEEIVKNHFKMTNELDLYKRHIAVW